jgi:hypothetical protein
VTDRLVIEVPHPRSHDGEPTTREDWIQGAMESMMRGLFSWCHGAGLITEPTAYVNPVVTPAEEVAE